MAEAPSSSSAPSDPALEAVDRLETALERLFDLLEARFAHLEEERVPRSEVEALSRRLDETLEKLKAAMADQGE
ncbi:hypothetical protein [Sabulicella glaciei]|uniref:Uncharacterized protein n=1 Tax=Sabulicella glaciei TaxID=2984948 RepID=A0ABT3NYM1_9PROT|nr:hypothetical protein [Roseococcus sp. MDT2-1-1]MCW8087258.1 hypothetical protein [Roseococcus sp. MDT2-1-1]